MKRLFVTGMVRSGTTLVSRALDAHPGIVCAPDPLLGFFRAFRNDLLRDRLGSWGDPEAPFSDLFFPEHPLLEIHAAASLRMPLDDASMARIRADLERFNMTSNSTRLLQYLPELQPQPGYAELLDAVLELLARTYGQSEQEAVWQGFKQTWVEAFAPAFLNTWPDARCVHVVRDPRAVVASWKETTHLTHDYPLLMIIRHWRKSAALASVHGRRFPGRFLICSYEDFVGDPRAEASVLCAWLGLPFSESMIDADRFRDGAGDAWAPNTSYGAGTTDISAELAAAWRERLSEEEVRYVEDMCAPEMRRWGYARSSESGAPGSLVSPPEIAMHNPGERDWLAQHAGGYAPSDVNRAKEFYRWAVATDPVLAAEVGERGLEAVLIDPRLAPEEAAAGGPEARS